MGSDESRGKLTRIYLKAVELPSERRAAFLDEVCAGDATLRREVETLLRHDLPTLDLWTPAVEAPADPETVGPYRIVERLGEGGMGIVYRAEQLEPVRRTVALKIIRYGLDIGSFLARFENERQALAVMDHSSIARIFDAGLSEDGRPYFVMELVEGEPINEYCEARQLSLDARLGLFVEVCEAVQHAHQKGVIHRDLKPSNVLVADIEGRPRPKIIDFGVAKATVSTLTARTVYTEIGMLIGTPEYMSPEQADLTGLDVDTRTDVYGLGVILYELLTGALPFDPDELRRSGLVEILRRIREEPVPRPSARAREVSGARTTRLSADLDWIVLRALEKDRERRYGSPSELAQDIRRYLDHEAVAAGPPSAAYRARKFVRRHRAALTAVTAVVLALIAGLVATTVQYRRTVRSEAQARREAYIANLRAAESNLRGNDVRGALDHLDACDPDLRGWEWRHLRHRLTADFEAEVPRPVGADGRSIRLDGNILRARTGNRVSLWDLETGDRDERTLDVDLSDPGEHLLAWSPSMDRALLVRGETVFVVETMPKGARAPAVELETGRVEQRLLPSFGFSPDESTVYRLVNGYFDPRLGPTLDRIEVFDATTGDLRDVLRPRDPSFVIAATASSGGNRVAACAVDRGEMMVWEVGGSGSHRSFQLDVARSGTSLCERVIFSDDGEWLIVAAGSTITVWNLDDGAEVGVWEAHAEGVSSVAIDRSRTKLATAGFDRRVRLWALDGLEAGSPTEDELFLAAFQDRKIVPRVAEWQGPLEIVTVLDFNENGHRLAALDTSGGLRVWSTDGDGAGALAQLGHRADGLVIEPSGDRALVGLVPAVDEPALAVRVDLESGRSSETIPRQGGRPKLDDEITLPSGVAYTGGTLWPSPDGSLLLETTNVPERVAILWAADDGRQLGFVDLSRLGTEPPRDDNPFRSPVRAAGISPDGKRIVFLLVDGSARLWDWETDHLRPALEDEPLLRAGRWSGIVGWEAADLVFSPAGRDLAVWSPTGVVVWDVDANRPRMRLDAGEVIRGAGPMAWSRDGARIAGCLRPDAVQRPGATGAAGASAVLVWSLDRRDPYLRVPGWADAVAFSPDGSRLVIGDQETLTVLDAGTGDRLLELEVGESASGAAVEAIAFDAAGDRMVVLLQSGTLRVFDTDRAEVTPQARGQTRATATAAPARVRTDLSGRWVATYPGLGDFEIEVIRRGDLLEATTVVDGDDGAQAQLLWQVHAGTLEGIVSELDPGSLRDPDAAGWATFTLVVFPDGSMEAESRWGRVRLVQAAQS